MKTLHFRDDKTFYDELTAALKSGEPVRVETQFRRYSEVPQRLKDIFEMQKHDRAAWMNVATGIFTAGTVACAATAVGLNYKALVVVGTVVAGAAIGCGIGAGVGAAVGAGIGLAAGTVAAVLMDGKHTAQVEITKDGHLVIKVEPARS